MVDYFYTYNNHNKLHKSSITDKMLFQYQHLPNLCVIVHKTQIQLTGNSLSLGGINLVNPATIGSVIYMLTLLY